MYDSDGISRVVIDADLRARVMMANLERAERVAFLLGRRHNNEAQVMAVVFPPLEAASETHAVFDMRWQTILRTTCRRLELEPALAMVGWMHSHPRMSIFLSSTDLPTAAAFRRCDPRVVAVVVNPFDNDDPIGGFAGDANQRIPVAFEALLDTPPELSRRLAALHDALPDFADVIAPTKPEPSAAQRRHAARAVQIRCLEGQRFLSRRLDALARRLNEMNDGEPERDAALGALTATARRSDR